MPPLSVPNNSPSTAFHDQFSEIIRLESRLHCDYSEDITGPVHARWVTQHLWDVARAQGFTLLPPTEPSTLNVHAQEFIASPISQSATDSRLEHARPWYDNFYLADQDGPDSSGYQLPATRTAAFHNPPSRYRPFDPLELSEYRAAVQAQLFNQRTNNQNGASGNAFSGPTNQFPDLFLHSRNSPPYPQLPTTPPTNLPHVRYPSTPPDRSTRQNHHHHRRQTSSLDDLSNLTTHTALCVSTEPTVQSRTDSPSAAPDHYKALTIYAIEIHIGDYIQSIDHPGTLSPSP